jgi:uncharacterized protein
MSMELARLIKDLSLPAAYPYPVERVDVRQTHISVVFLAGPFVYKLKKPVNLGFVDFTTPDKRRHFCDEEVRLNRRLAPDVYLGVVEVAQTADGFKVEGQGDAVDWAVKMRRLPDDATLHERLGRNEVSVELVESLAQRIASFHSAGETNERIGGFGRFESVSRLVLDIFDQAADQVGTTVSDAVFRRAKALAERSLDRLRPIIEARAARSMPRDCHGDLHLDHVYHFPDRKPPADLVIVDCIEFNERFRFVDPVADMAFPAMDLAFHGRRNLARRFVDAYFSATGDEEGRALVPLYAAYRATVRGLVEGLKLAEPEVPAHERSAAWVRSRAHWLLALGGLEEPDRKPCLVLVGGLPGTGKSELARRLAPAANFAVIRSDVVRKELAGLPAQETSSPELRPPLYAAEWSERTYAECLHRAEEDLFEGRRVIVDATFREEKKRRMFFDAARQCSVPCIMLQCQARPETVRQRLQNRHGDASDADWAIYQKFVEQWETSDEHSGQTYLAVSTEGMPDEGVAQALEVLRQENLY